MKNFRDKDYEKSDLGHQIIPISPTRIQREALAGDNRARLRGMQRHANGDTSLTSNCLACSYPFIYRKPVSGGLYRWECECCGYSGGSWQAPIQETVAIYIASVR